MDPVVSTPAVHSELTDQLIRLALEEDLGAGDVTTESTVPVTSQSVAHVVARQDLVVSGLGAFERVFAMVDDSVRVRADAEPGEAVQEGATVVTLEGSTRSILGAERTALNLLGALCGMATMTRAFVSAIEGTGARIVDTRKTPPGMRALAKRAVLDGGGGNHRFSLSGGVLIKENHIEAAGGLRPAVAAARDQAPHSLKVEVEVQDLAEVDEALEVGADILLLDNMSLEMMAEAVRRTRCLDRAVILEASGNLTLERVRSVAQLGVDLLSVGALTHSAPVADLSLLITRNEAGGP